MNNLKVDSERIEVMTEKTQFILPLVDFCSLFCLSEIMFVYQLKMSLVNPFSYNLPFTRRCNTWYISKSKSARL